MSGFDKRKYIDSGVWVDNDYLVNPKDAAKRCISCDGRYYTVEFYNCSFFVDNKLPVCGFCTHASSRNFDRARQAISDLGITVACSVCGSDTDLVDCYRLTDKRSTVVYKCKSCQENKK